MYLLATFTSMYGNIKVLILAEFHRLSEFDIDERLLSCIKEYGMALIKLSTNANVILEEMADESSIDNNTFFNDFLVQGFIGLYKDSVAKIYLFHVHSGFAGYMALISICLLFNEDPLKIFFPVESRPDNISTPLILYAGESVHTANTFTIIVDETEVAEAFEILFSTFYVFNIQYTKKALNFYMFIQRFVLNMNDKTPPPRKVLSVITKLTNK
ncbi:hypothetical protein LOTGIDRAFT_153411 [Lottia gigantea]|uniref:Uncharacterized protein n=1 Tax=Lottia gigantea TaxID=225164 RepID=V3ZR98_LOTGI|nr:hypothetical protein LOTGIDRAFT_153411 [Lottia gigantea]ESO93938.1 hypothetical protein LOTGIDRAFT_153411 [Lottia gigantea]